GLWGMRGGCAGMVWHMLGLWRLVTKNRAGVERRRSVHRQRLGELATRFQLKEDTLVALDDLRQAPLIHNLARLLGAVMLDRVALVLFATLVAGVLLIALPPVWALAGVGASSMVTAGALPRVRGDIDPNERMKAVPEKIRSHVHAKFVVFGHSHQPVALPLADGGMYFNTGTWVATEKPGLLRAFTHVVIRPAEDGARAVLCQWRDGRSTEFAPEPH